MSDATSHISEMNITITSLTGDKRRMETDFQGMHRDLDDAIVARRAADEKADRLQGELTRVTDQLHSAQESYSSSESFRKQLEVQLKEITIRLEEAESTKDGRKSLAKLQSRVSHSARGQTRGRWVRYRALVDGILFCHIMP